MNRLGLASFALAASALVAACSSSDPAPAGPDSGTPDSAVTGPIDVTIDTFNVALAGAFVPNEAARRPKIVEALAAHDADVVCLQEVWTEADKTAIAEAAKGAYPHVVRFETDLATPIDDPTDHDGNVVTPPSTAPCADPALNTALGDGIDCLKANCNTIPGSEDGQTTSAKCASDSCVAHVATLLGADDKRCYGCLLANIPASSFAQMRTECGTNPNGGLAFGGRNGVMILSKHPLTESAMHVLPATWNRRIIARATVNLPNGAKVDVHCNHVAPLFNDPLYLYTGQYGKGATDKQGWANEQILHAKKMIAFQKTRPDARAILLGDLNASREEGDIEGEGSATLDELEAVYDEAIAPGYTPACTFCDDNPNTGGGENTWLDRIFLSGIPKSAVKSSARLFTEATVDGATGKVPISDHYGYRVVVEIAP